MLRSKSTAAGVRFAGLSPLSEVSLMQVAVMKQHVRRAVVCSVSATVVAAFGFRWFLGELGAEALGRLFAIAAFAGLMCGWLAGRAKPSWSLFKFTGVYAACFAAAILISARGHTSPGASAADARGFSVQWPDGLTVQHLDGVSSADSDRSLGYRERGLLGSASAPKGVIEVACGTKPEHPMENSAALADVLAATTRGYQAQGFNVTTTAPTPQRMGAFDGTMAQMSASHEEHKLRQSIAITQNAQCMLSVTYTAKAEDYEANLASYIAVLASLR